MDEETPREDDAPVTIIDIIPFLNERGAVEVDLAITRYRVAKLQEKLANG